MPSKFYKNNVPEKIIVFGGEYVAVDNDIILSTTLGSCVAACLYDEINNVIGMNHILLSHQKYSETINCNSKNGKYGHCAMDLLIEEMVSLGARVGNLKAKAFGGSSINYGPQPCSGNYCIGDINIAYVKEFLKEIKIPLVANDFGGNYGRSIQFYPNTFKVAVKTLNKSASENLFKQERNKSKPNK